MFILTFFSAPLFFRHQKDSGRWRIYNTDNLFGVICILILWLKMLQMPKKLSAQDQKFWISMKNASLHPLALVGRGNMHLTIEFCPDPPEKKINVPKLHSSEKLTVLLNVHTVMLW